MPGKKRTRRQRNNWFIHYIQNPISSDDFENLIQQRRSIRIFQDKAIPQKTLLEFVQNMRFSPTASNSQGLSFTIITDQNSLKAINDISIETLLNVFNKVTNPMVSWLIKVAIGKDAFSKLKEGKNKFSRKAKLDSNMICYNAPALILIHAAKGASSMPESDANIWIGMATLYAETLKLATCINGYIVNAAKRNKKINDMMNIPKHHQLHGAVLIGYPKMKYKQRIDRIMPDVNIC